MDLFGMEIQTREWMPKDQVWIAKAETTMATNTQGDEHLVIDFNLKQNAIIKMKKWWQFWK